MFYAMSEQNVCLLHNAWSEASDLFRIVSIFVFIFVRPCFLGGLLFCCSAQSMQPFLCGVKPCLTMEGSDTSSTSSCSSLLTSPDFEEYDEHNVWNPMLNLFCHEYVGAVMESCLD